MKPPIYGVVGPRMTTQTEQDVRDLITARFTWLADTEITARIERAKHDPKTAMLLALNESNRVIGLACFEHLTFDANATAFHTCSVSNAYAGQGIGTHLTKMRLEMNHDRSVYVTTKRPAFWMNHCFREIDKRDGIYTMQLSADVRRQHNL